MAHRPQCRCCKSAGKVKGVEVYSKTTGWCLRDANLGCFAPVLEQIGAVPFWDRGCDRACQPWQHSRDNMVASSLPRLPWLAAAHVRYPARHCRSLMLSAPGQFSTLTQQVANAIASNIERGVWTDQLPPERYLARSLQVSRRTLRSAIEILRSEKVLLTMPGLGSQITRASRPRAGRSARRKVVGLMMPESFAHMKPSTMVFIDELRTLLYTRGFQLEVHVGHRYYSNRPSSALVELTSKHPADGWILIYSNPINQGWFKAQKIPVVIAGTAHEKIDLPDVDVDMFAACRHAANLFIQKGHRRLALVVEDIDLPNEKKSENGFLEGARLLGKADVTTKTWRCPVGLQRIRNLAERLVRGGPDSASAVLVTNAHQYLALFSILTRMGVKIPGDISLISRNDEHFFQFLEPEPARYTCAPQTRAKAVLSALMRTIQGEHLPKRHFWLVPDFISGATVAAAKDSGPVMESK